MAPFFSFPGIWNKSSNTALVRCRTTIGRPGSVSKPQRANPIIIFYEATSRFETGAPARADLRFREKRACKDCAEALKKISL